MQFVPSPSFSTECAIHAGLSVMMQLRQRMYGKQMLRQKLSARELQHPSEEASPNRLALPAILSHDTLTGIPAVLLF